MADYQNGAVKGLQRSLYGFTRHNIQMVCRFVKHQTVGTVQHQLQQHQACLLTTAQLTDFLKDIITVEQHTAKHRACMFFRKAVFNNKVFQQRLLRI